MTPHKHAAVIKAWADGAEIEVRDPKLEDCWSRAPAPHWSPTLAYRVKPTLVEKWCVIYTYNEEPQVCGYGSEASAKKSILTCVDPDFRRRTVKLIIDPTTNQIKDFANF